MEESNNMFPAKFCISGEVVIEPIDASFSNAVAYIRLEDVTFADCSSKVICEQVLTDVKHDPNMPNEPIFFFLEGTISNPNGRYTISVHIDVNNNGRIDDGDFISMESFPIANYDGLKKFVITAKVIK